MSDDTTKSIVPAVHSRTIEVNLHEHFISFMAKLIQSGRYATTDEIIRAGLRTLEEYEHNTLASFVASDEGKKALLEDKGVLYARHARVEPAVSEGAEALREMFPEEKIP